MDLMKKLEEAFKDIHIDYDPEKLPQDVYVSIYDDERLSVNYKCKSNVLGKDSGIFLGMPIDE